MVKTWTDIPVARPADRVTVHYHRPDNHYDGANLWSWDGDGKKTPLRNEIAPVGQDDFGPVFEFDRANYGGSGKIGLITRLGHDWQHKDGTDKFWTPALGNEIWFISGSDVARTKRPDLTPHVAAAFADGPSRLIVTLSELPRLTVEVSILDEKDAVRPAQAAGPARALADDTFAVSVVPAEPLDVVGHPYRVQVQGFGAPVPLVPRGVLDDRAQFFDADVPLGAIYDPQKTVFRLFAPTARAVGLVLYDQPTGGPGQPPQALEREPKGFWSATVSGDLAGKFYAYRVEGAGLDGRREVLDPYAVNAVASSTRGRVGSLPPPASPGPALAAATDAVIYEMHVRDFTSAESSGVSAAHRGRYLGFTEAGTHLPGDEKVRTALDHLSELGVTHVELLPVQDYEGSEVAPAAFNWGYVPTDYFSPEGSYATSAADASRVEEFKALVDALHARGIGVILDVVYNHTSREASLFGIAPGYYYRHLDSGALAEGSGCGNELRTESPMGRRLVLDSLKFWTKQYGIDGYRFDLMALIDRETMLEAERELRAINPSILLFGEPWTGGPTPLREQTDKAAMTQMGVIGAFNDDFRNALKGSPDGSDAGFIQDGSNREALKSALGVSAWFAEPGQSINYLTCHDNLVLWDKLKASMPGAVAGDLVETMKLGYLALFTSQGVAYFQGGEEFARTKGGNNNSYDSPDAVNQVDWTLKRDHADLWRYVRDAIALRKAHPVFRLRTRAEVAQRLHWENTGGAGKGGGTLCYTLDGAGVPGETWQRVLVALHGDGQTPVQLTLPAGTWTVAFDEHGAAPGPRMVSGTITVRQKSGLVLYQ